MSVPRLEQSGHQPPTPSLDQIASRSQVQVEDSQLTSDLSSLPPSSSSPNKMGQSSVKPVAPVVEREEVGNSFINSNHATQVKQPVQPTPATQEPKVHRRKPSKADSNHPPQAPPTPAATNSPLSNSSSTSFPLPSFLSEDPLSSDPNSSSDEDALGYPKPPRPPRFSKSTGLPRPRPSYYYDAEYDPGTAGTKKKGRRGGFKGVPVFEPTMEDFEKNGGFYGYVKRIEKYGLRSGIVKVIPPKEWSETLPSVISPLHDIRLKEPIEQHMIGSQGLYRVTNVAKSRIWNAAQWKESANLDKFDAPDLIAEQKKGDRSERSTKSTSAATAAKKQRIAANKKEKEEREADGEFDADEEEEDGSTPKKGRRTPAKKLAKSPAVGKGKEKDNTETNQDGTDPQPPPAKKKRLTVLQKAEPTEEEWEAFSNKFTELPHGMKKEDYTVEMMRDFERRYWRTLTFGEPPMYGADMAGSLFDDSTTAWNVAHLGDLLPKLAPKACSIPGVVSPYLYFGMWRATFAWHVEDADLYSINYIHFGAPKFWYSVPQEQSEKFERVMEGFFPTDRSKCSQFLRHKAFLASPRVLSNNGITLNRCAQLPGEFILTYPKGYHSGFNLGYNCAESINFATERWLPLGKVAKSCHCIDDSVSIDVNIWLKESAKAEALERGDPWPFVDSAEEEEPLAPAGTSTTAAVAAPPPVQRKRMASTAEGGAPRKRAKPSVSQTAQSSATMYDMGITMNLNAQQKAQLAQYIQQQAMAAGLTTLTPPQQYQLEQQYMRLLTAHLQQQQQLRLQQQQEAKLAAKSQGIAAPQPVSAPAPKLDFVCALCPEMNTEGLVAIGESGVKSSKKQNAHRLCVMFTPATWIEQDATTGKEMVRGFKKIEKARWKLKCSLCTELHGTKVQCTKGKCAKSFHVSCALAEGSGVFLDATLPEVGGGQVSVLAATKAGDAPPSPSKASASTSAATGEQKEETMPQIEPEGELKLTILCRTHNPDWKLQEQGRKAAELNAKLESLKQGDRIRVKVSNGTSYDVFFVSNVPEKESVNIAYDDRSPGIVKWKNILWPESEEVRRKKEEAARRAEQQKADALDRAAYRDNIKKRTPIVPSAAPMIQSRSGSQSHPSIPPSSVNNQSHYQVPAPAQHAHYYPNYAYPSPAPSYNYPPPYPHSAPPQHHPTPYAYSQSNYYQPASSNGASPYSQHLQMPPNAYAHQAYPQQQSQSFAVVGAPRQYPAPPQNYPQNYTQQSHLQPLQRPSSQPSNPSSHSFSHLLNSSTSQPNSRPHSPFAQPSQPQH